MENYKQKLFSGKRKFVSIPVLTFLGLLVLASFSGPSTQVDSLQDSNQPVVNLNNLGEVNAEKSEVKLTPKPTVQVTPTPTPVVTPAPTPKPTATPTPQPTLAPTISQPAYSSYMGGDKDCADFNTHAEAQAFYIAQGGPASDPHRLDGNDNDGLACESLL